VTPFASYALDWVRLTGGLWEEERPGLYRVILPHAPAGFEGLSLITDDPEIARERPDAHLVAPASPLFDAVVADGRAQGRLSLVHVGGLAWNPSRIAAAVAGCLRLEDTRFELTRFAPMEHHYGIFNFRASFESDVIESELVSVCVNLNNGRLARRVPAAVARAIRLEAPMEPLPPVPRAIAQEAHRVARQEAESKLAAARQGRLHEVATRRSAERSRAERYYEDLRREIEEDLRTERDERRTGVLRSRLAAVQADCGRAIADIDARHELRVSLDLGSVLVVAQPKIVLDCLLTHKKGWTGRLALTWDPLLEEVEPVDCPRCRQLGYEFTLSRTAVFCPACARS